MGPAKITDLREDDHGLFVEARLRDNWLVEPVRAAIVNGAIDGMSFRFAVPDGGDDWDRSGPVPLRTVKEVRLFELGPVTFPAYDDTSVMVRSLIDAMGHPAEFTPDEGSPEPPSATPDEGSRNLNRFAALLRVRDF